MKKTKYKIVICYKDDGAKISWITYRHDTIESIPGRIEDQMKMDLEAANGCTRDVLCVFIISEKEVE